jgi:hypothetical protein
MSDDSTIMFSRSIMDESKSVIDNSRVILQIVASLTIVIYEFMINKFL